MDGDVELTEVVLLRRQVEALELERNVLEERLAEVEVLQSLFAAIAVTLDASAIVHLVLRGIVEALQVRRAIHLELDADGRVRRSVVCGENGLPEESTIHQTFRRNGIIDAIARGDEKLVVGQPGDQSTPVPDTVGSFAVAPYLVNGVVRGLLYIDNPVYEPISDGQLRLLLDFARHTGLAVERAAVSVEMKRVLDAVHDAALTDTLTGLHNRRALELHFERELASAERYGAHFAYAIVDVDNFKAINDARGHDGGDEALKTFARCLLASARQGDVVARFAGDEFAIIMSKAREQDATIALDRIVRAIRAEGLQCSIGAALYPRDGSTVQEMHTAADAALYTAKRNGKDRFEIYVPPSE